MSGKERKTNRHSSVPISGEQIEMIQALAGEIRYGTVTLVIQDGGLVQIDRSEKIRVTKKTDDNP